jgi:hypothetical protein
MLGGEMAEGPKSSAFNRELLVILPLAGSAIAITYDVGYFSALDINYFTMFSVSEHIVFAFEALPLALLATLSLVVAPIAWAKGREGRVKDEHYERLTGKKREYYKTKCFGSASCSLSGSFPWQCTCAQAWPLCCWC